MSSALEGRMYRFGTEGYEQARRAVTWHAGTPNRFPALIVQARNEHDVVAAMRLARTEDMQVAVRSGGHSWAGSHLRDGILLLDVSQLREVSINAEQMTATVQPGLRGAELNKALRAHHLFFPIGHCTGVGLGGYLLQGGFGWSGRPLGPACMSVTGIDVVTADGERLYADERQHADLFWAARGSGPGFFAVVTRFHLKLSPRPRVTMNSGYTYPIEAFERVYRWVHEIGRETPAEINVILTRDESMRKEEPVIVLNATAFADSEQEARSALSLYERCPARHHALAARINEVTTIAELSRIGLDPHFDPTRRYVADNMWTHAPFDDLLPGLRAIIETLPPAPSHMLLMNWGYTYAPQRPAMAFSVEDNFYYALYVAWNDPAEDDTYKNWVTERIRALEPCASGIQLADENLINRPARFVSDDHLRRLDQIRAIYDQDGRFVAWLGRPPLA